jgi:hypothetical protein
LYVWLSPKTAIITRAKRSEYSFLESPLILFDGVRAEAANSSV